MAHLQLVSLVVRDYDRAIAFFVGVLDFELIEDVPSRTTSGHSKRWVVVRPRGGQTGVLLARADGAAQDAIVGAQHGGRVGFFLQVDDFDATHARMMAAGVEFVAAPRLEPYGRVVVFSTARGIGGIC
ncbi:MAG: VOC family protein [Gemmatimonadaceae bacterium]|nr:VOC family protein [Gemmatimonadaceae bacterium]